jgi:hypothetical protein
VTASGANLTEIEEKFYRSWVQIGEKLGCKSPKVAFEPINEPPADTSTDGEEINKLNELFLQALEESGGYNSQRVVTLVGGGEDVTMTGEWLKVPTGYTNPFAIQYHYYSPCKYTSNRTKESKLTEPHRRLCFPGLVSAQSPKERNVGGLKLNEPEGAKQPGALTTIRQPWKPILPASVETLQTCRL